MRETARAAAWWLNCARGSSLLCLLATRPGRSVYKPHSPISRPNVLNHIAKPHPQRTSDLARGPQAPCSSTRSRAAALRPRVMPPGASGFRPSGRNPRTKRPQPHCHRPTILQPDFACCGAWARGPARGQRSEVSPRALRASVSRRGRRRSQGGMTDASWFEP